jgi:hypothetical protein
MPKLLITLALLAPVLAHAQGTAYDALRVIGTQFNRDAVNHVISMTGVDGTPQPETWKVLLDDPKARGGVREMEVRNGRIISERTPLRQVAGTSEGATINTARLNLDSSGAYSVASHTAEQSHVPFETVTYTLRTDDRGEPIWIVTLQGQGQRPVGTIHIGANRGAVTRTEGMYAGGGMDQVVNANDQDQNTDDVDEDNPDDENFVKLGIKRWFHRTAEDAHRTFQKVRRSFADFIRGDDKDD